MKGVRKVVMCMFCVQPVPDVSGGGSYDTVGTAVGHHHYRLCRQVSDCDCEGRHRSHATANTSTEEEGSNLWISYFVPRVWCLLCFVGDTKRLRLYNASVISAESELLWSIWINVISESFLDRVLKIKLDLRRLNSRNIENRAMRLCHLDVPHVSLNMVRSQSFNSSPFHPFYILVCRWCKYHG